MASFLLTLLYCQFADESFLLRKPVTSNHGKLFVDFVVMSGQFADESFLTK